VTLENNGLGAEVRRVVREDGLRSLFAKAAYVTWRCLFRHIKSYIYQLDLRKRLPEIEVPVRLAYRMAHEVDIVNLHGEKYDYDEGAKEYLTKRMKQGDRCILASLSDQVVGYMWIMKGAMELSQDRLVSLSEEKAYTYKNFVIGELRGRRVLAGLDQFAINLLRSEGVDFIITTVDHDNLSAITARKRIGFEKIGVINHYRVFGCSVDRVQRDTLKHLQTPTIS